MKRENFIHEEESKYCLSENAKLRLLDINKKISDRSQHRKVKVFVCAGDGNTIARPTSTKRISLTPKEFLDEEIVLNEIEKLRPSFYEGTESSNGYKYLEIYISSNTVDNLGWENQKPIAEIQDNIIILSCRVSGEYGGVFRDNLAFEAHVVIPNIGDGFSDLEECTITIDDNGDRAKKIKHLVQQIFRTISINRW